MAGRVVDLTLSDSDGEPAPKRRRCQAARTEPDTEDSDVVLVDPGAGDIEVLGPQLRAPAQGRADDADLGDEDLVITNATGQVATRDLPHPRPDCAEHRHNASTSTSNASFCSQCYCYVCDGKASECRFWGTGARERDHANSRNLGYWRRLREAARAGNRGLVHAEYHGTGPLGTGLPPKPPQQARLPFPFAGLRTLPGGASGAAAGTATAFGAGASAGWPSSGEGAGTSTAIGGHMWSMQAAAAATAPANSAAPSRGATSPAAAPSVPTPSRAAEAAAPPVAKTQPGTAQLPTGVCKLKQLPNPTNDRNAFELGVLRFNVKAARGLTILDLVRRMSQFGFYYNTATRQEDYGDKLALENVFETAFGNHGGKYKSKAVYLKLLPLPPPPEEAVPVSTERVRKVLVVDCLGRMRATVLGVRVRDKVKRADLLVALAPMLQPPFSASSELLHVLSFHTFEYTNVVVIGAEKILDDAFFETFHCNEDHGPHLVVYRTAHHPSPTWDTTSEASSAAGPPKWTQLPTYLHSSTTGSLLSASFGGPPAWIVALVRQLKPPPDADAPAPERMLPSTTRLSVPVLLPLRREHVKGGREAAKESTAALLRALRPYRTDSPLSAAHAGPVAMLRGNRTSMTELPAQFSNSMRWGVIGETIGLESSVQLTALMAHDLPASAYRLAEMREPALDPSAVSEVMRQSLQDATEAKHREVRNLKRKQFPSQCIHELVRASRRPHPEDRATIASMHQLGGSCVLATELVLTPSVRAGAGERDGEAIIKVYTWSSHAHGRNSLFAPWDDWPSIGKKDSVGFPLPITIQLLSTGAADPTEHAHRTAAVSSAAGAAGSTGGGPSTSSSRATAAGAEAAGGPLTAAAALLKRRVHAERQRARDMWAEVKALSESRVMDRYRSINGLLDFMQSGERPAAQQPPGLTVAMRPYQLQSLGFMLELERLVDALSSADGAAAGPSTSAGTAAAQLDPADPDAPDGGCPGGYRRLFWLPITNSNGQRYWYSPVFNRLSREVPMQPVGGFLAEEMGLGKTVEVMALTLANPPPPSVVAGTKLPCGRITSGATLVVCAVSLVGQWQTEAQNKTSGSCRIHPYHGPNRIRDPQRLATEFDVVVTTYQTLQSDHTGAKDPCQAIKWHRIVFDEGHTLRSPAAKMYKTAVELAADRKWLCTGTPINNALDDLLGQLGAVHMLPLGKKTYFDSYIKAPFLGNQRGLGLTILPILYAIRRTMIRHTKAQNLGGQGVLQLPQKTETDIPVSLNAEEQALYRKVHKEALRGWQKLKSVGPAYVNSHLFTATSMLMPLRRICSGGLLEQKDLTVPDPERLSALGGSGGGASGGGAAAAAEGSREVQVPEDISECPICVDTLDQPVVTTCNHWFCRECLMDWINQSPHHNCPACRQPILASALRRGVLPGPPPAPEVAAAAGGAAAPPGAVPCESKLRIMLAELLAMRAADPTAKALVFTQFGQTLEWLKPRLIAEKFGYRMITGDMTQKRRTEAIESFQNDPSTIVFLLSVRSGAVGINLTAANYVFLLEPCMNPAMEEQAIGRAWRMGQQRPVVVKRLFVKGSVEERIMEVVKARRAANGSSAAAAAAAAFGGPAGSGASTSSVRGAASTAFAGSLRQDKTDLRINELEVMFRDPDFAPPPAGGAATTR